MKLNESIAYLFMHYSFLSTSVRRYRKMEVSGMDPKIAYVPCFNEFTCYKCQMQATCGAAYDWNNTEGRCICKRFRRAWNVL